MANPIGTIGGPEYATPGASNALTTPPPQSSSFGNILSTMLIPDAQGKVNEEQLFAALIGDRLESLKGRDVVTAFQDRFSSHQQSMTQANGYVPIESAARAALQDLSEEGLLSIEEAESLHAQAFKAAQLDDNANALYDSRGSSYDQSIAVTLVELAIQSAEEKVRKFDTGEADAGRLAFDLAEDVPARGVTEGQFVGGGGFLYKPVSESNGNLVILLPRSMGDNVSAVTLMDNAGNVIESGDSYGIYDDGRPLFRFNRSGSGYPDNLTVQARTTSGENVDYFIPDSSRRWE